jgi:hypothetical protein
LRGNFTSYAFIPLFPEPWKEASCQRLSSNVNPQARMPVACLRPPIHGLAFLTATGRVSSVLDEWWRAEVPAASLPILLMPHEPGLHTWVTGLDVAFVIGVANEAELDLYQEYPNVSAAIVREPMELTEHAMRVYGGKGMDCFLVDPPRPRWPQQGTARQDDRVTGPAPQAESQRQPSPVGAWVPDPIQSLAAARPVISNNHPPQAPDLEAISHPQERTWYPGASPPPQPGHSSRTNQAGAHRRSPLGTLIRRAAGGLYPGRRSEVPEELATLALVHTHGKIVGVISRAGGVGKTAVAAAVGIIYGEAVEDSGGSAAVVDQNVGNPDQFGRMELDRRVRTVSEIMADIEGGREWSIPAWNHTPALAIYPERRAGSDGYTLALIERLAGQLRNLHMISVVDLPNCLPAFTSGTAALSAGWLSVADLVTIPTTDDPTRLRGVIELLDTPLIKGDARNGYRSVPVVVAYVRSPLRALREDRSVLGFLDQIRDRVVEVVEIPKDERATLAIVRGQPVTEINPALRRAYIELSLAIARALANA